MLFLEEYLGSVGSAKLAIRGGRVIYFNNQQNVFGRTAISTEILRKTVLSHEENVVNYHLIKVKKKIKKK